VLVRVPVVARARRRTTAESGVHRRTQRQATAVPSRGNTPRDTVRRPTSCRRRPRSPR
jgi:hypothetical protein